MSASEHISIGLMFTVPGLLHTFGLYLFLTTQVTKLAHNQKLYYINISLCTLSKCVLKIAYEILIALCVSDNVTNKIWTLDTGALFIGYILFLVVLTVDRFLEIYLNITYPLWSTRKSTMILITLSWCITATSWILLCLLEDTRAKRIVILYLWPSSEFLFLIVAILVYSYLFVKIRKKRQILMPAPTIQLPNDNVLTTRRSVSDTRKSNPNDATIHNEINNNKSESNGDNDQLTDKSSVSAANNSRQNPETSTDTDNRKKRRRRFFIPILLVATFVMFWTVPDMIDFALTLSGQSVKYNHYMLIPLNILICIAMSSDAVIYMFLVVELRKRLKKIFCI